ncbi:MAG: ABC transporter permease [Candidatus Hydrogenedentota bacterium]
MSEVRIACPETLDQNSGRALLGDLMAHKLGKDQTVILDFSKTRNMDSRGGAAVIEMSEFTEKRRATFSIEGQTGEVAEFLELVQPSLGFKQPPKKAEPNTFEELGDFVLRGLAESRQFSALLVDAIYWTILAPFEGEHFRWNMLIDEIYEMGVRAVRIVALMNFLLGLIIAMLSAKQVETFGISIYVADLIMIAFARELAAIMTAIVVSARTGAAITAEIATMKVQEEIDALRGMGINVTQFLVAPKLLALVLVMPCLTVIGLIAGVLGGAFWGVFVLDFQPSVWFTETQNAAYIEDFVQGFSKCFVFAIAIALIGCHNGFRVTGASRGVGRMTTRSVVQDIFMIICIDIIFAMVFYYFA